MQPTAHRTIRQYPGNLTDQKIKWYAREDSNLHPLRDRILNPARLPIPPLARPVKTRVFGNFPITQGCLCHFHFKKRHETMMNTQQFTPVLDGRKRKVGNFCQSPQRCNPTKNCPPEPGKLPFGLLTYARGFTSTGFGSLPQTTAAAVGRTRNCPS